MIYPDLLASERSWKFITTCTCQLLGMERSTCREKVVKKEEIATSDVVETVSCDNCNHIGYYLPTNKTVPLRGEDFAKVTSHRDPTGIASASAFSLSSSSAPPWDSFSLSANRPSFMRCLKASTESGERRRALQDCTNTCFDKEPPRLQVSLQEA